MAVFAVQGPCDLLVEGLQRGLSRLGDVAHDRMHRLALIVPLLALNDIFGGDASLRKIDVTYTQP